MLVRAAVWDDARNDSGAFAILAEVGDRRKLPAAVREQPNGKRD